MNSLISSAFLPSYLVGAVALMFSSVGLWFADRRSRVVSLIALAIGISGLVLAATARGIVVGRLPVIGTFENTLVTAVCIAAIALGSYFTGPFRQRAEFARMMAPFALLALALGRLAPQAPLPIDATGRSIIGYAHAFVGWLGFAFLLAAAVAAFGFLLASGSEDSQPWEEALTRFLGLGFALLTFTIASGSLYSFILFGSWNRWQIVETAAGMAWLAYAAVLHSRLLQRWRGRKLAIVSLAAFPTALVAFWVWAIYPNTYHYFDALLRVR